MSNYIRVQEYRDDPGYSEYRDDVDASIQDLIGQIRSNIFRVNNGANTVERAMKNIGTEKDSLHLRDKIHNTSQSTNTLVKTTTRLLHSVVEKMTNKQQRVQMELLKSQFQDAVQRFHTLQKKAADKVKQTAFRSGIQKAQKPLISFDDDSEQKTLFKEEQQQRIQVLKDQAVIIEDDLVLIQEREERIRQLEADILDVNEIFRDLGSLIQAQGETLDTIDSNVEHAAQNVEIGNEELVKASQYQRKSRKKTCCLIIIFLIIAIILAIIITLSAKL